MGTLLELGNCTLDVLRDLVNRPAGQSILPIEAMPTRSSDPELDVRQGVLTARRSLETVLTYAVTQLAMWLLKPDFESSTIHGSESMTADWGADDEKTDGKEHRSHARPSTSLAERVRRGMTGEIAADLQALITKAKPIIEKSDSSLDPSGKAKGVNLTDVLGRFLQERVIVDLLYISAYPIFCSLCFKKPIHMKLYIKAYVTAYIPFLHSVSTSAPDSVIRIICSA